MVDELDCGSAYNEVCGSDQVCGGCFQPTSGRWVLSSMERLAIYCKCGYDLG